MGHHAVRQLHRAFRESPEQDSLVYTSLDRAIQIDRLRRAIETSETCGEFRQTIGSEAHADLFGDDFYSPDPDNDSEDRNKNELEPSSGARFDSDWVPGSGDGDDAPWLAQEMDPHAPPESLERYARYVESVFNGPFFKIDPDAPFASRSSFFIMPLSSISNLRHHIKLCALRARCARSNTYNWSSTNGKSSCAWSSRKFA
jgi:hypothetical protein